jgi:hypothetical protein
MSAQTSGEAPIIGHVWPVAFMPPQSSWMVQPVAPGFWMVMVPEDRVVPMPPNPSLGVSSHRIVLPTTKLELSMDAVVTETALLTYH